MGENETISSSQTALCLMYESDTFPKSLMNTLYLQQIFNIQLQLQA